MPHGKVSLRTFVFLIKSITVSFHLQSDQQCSVGAAACELFDLLLMCYQTNAELQLLFI